MASFYCFHCMHPIAGMHDICPACGHDNHKRQNGPHMLPGCILNGQYLIGRVLGCGGFGITYLGYDLNLQRVISVKEFFPGRLAMRRVGETAITPVAGMEDAYRRGYERALRESRMAASLGSIPGVVQVYNVAAANNTVYLIMEYIEGCTLSEYIKNRGEPLTAEEMISILTPAAQALIELHSRHIIHRDLKPDNIMLRKQDGRTVLLDFGAARSMDTEFSMSGAVITRSFSPMEQYSSLKLTERADEYALAATIYYLLTADYPTESIHRIAAMRQPSSICALNPTVSPELEAVIFRGMELQPENRYPTVQAFWNQLLSPPAVKAKPARHAAGGKAVPDKSLENAKTEKVDFPRKPAGSPPPSAASPSQKKQLTLLVSLISILLAVSVLIFLLTRP